MRREEIPAHCCLRDSKLFLRGKGDDFRSWEKGKSGAVGKKGGALISLRVPFRPRKSSYTSIFERYFSRYFNLFRWLTWSGPGLPQYMASL
jgi:hypothetical protein